MIVPVHGLLLRVCAAQSSPQVRAQSVTVRGAFGAGSVAVFTRKRLKKFL